MKLTFKILDLKGAHKIAIEFLQAISRVFPPTDGSIIESYKQKTDESAANFRAHLETPLLWHSGLNTINEVTQPALAALL